MADPSPKRYDPSELKLAALRSRGVHATAAGLPALLGLLFALGALLVVGWGLLELPMRRLIETALSGPADGAAMPATLGRALLLACSALVVVAVGGVAGRLAGSAIQTGVHGRWAGAGTAAAGSYAMPSRRYPDRVCATLLAAAFVSLAVLTILRVVEGVAGLGAAQVQNAGWVWAVVGRPVLYTFLPGAIALVIIEIVSTRYWFMKAAGMTEAEKRREMQDQEVGWLTRLRRRAMRGGVR